MPSERTEVRLIENILMVKIVCSVVLNEISYILGYPNQCYDETTKKAYSFGVHRPSGSCYELECFDNFTVELRT